MILKRNGCMEVCLLSITVPMHGLMEKDLRISKECVDQRNRSPLLYNCFTGSTVQRTS